MTIVFSHHGNTIGEVTLDQSTALDDAQVFAATSMRLPIALVLDTAREDGAEVYLYNVDDHDRTVTAWQIVTA